MSANNQIANKPRFTVAIQTEKYQQLINNTLKDPNRAQQFVAAVTAAVSANPTLQQCEAGSVLSAALLGEALKLSPSPQLGHYYMVPFDVAVRGADGKIIYDQNKNKITEKRAQFQMGYKGYIQLAVRSGYYRRINTLIVKEGELLLFDPVDEIIKLKLIEDENKREATPTIGYYAMFEYHNGFRKALYWTKEKMEYHADKYSAAFNLDTYKKLQAGQIPQNELWKYSSFWYKDFDTMAIKTMLRQLISKWGIMSAEFQQVFEKDSAILSTDGSYEYPTYDDPFILPPEPPTIPDTPDEPKEIDFNAV